MQHEKKLCCFFFIYIFTENVMNKAVSLEDDYKKYIMIYRLQTEIGAKWREKKMNLYIADNGRKRKILS